jgi:hypothetical protein
MRPQNRKIAALAIASLCAVPSLDCKSGGSSSHDDARSRNNAQSVDGASSSSSSSNATAGDPAPERPEIEEQAAGGVAWSGPVPVDRGGGYAGPWRMNDSKFYYVDDPSVDVLDSGHTGVIWVDNRRQDVFYRAYGADGAPGFDRAAAVSRNPKTFSWLPRLVVADGAVYALWQEIIFSGGSHGGEAMFARSTDGGRSFDEPINLSNSKAGDGKGRLTAERWDNGSLDLALGPDGAIYTAWTEYEGKLWFRRSTDGGASFEPSVHVGGNAKIPARGPALAVAPDGTIYLVCTIGEDPGADLRLARSTDGGATFEEARVVRPSDGHADGPGLAIDDEGTLHLVYGEGPRGPFGPHRVVYTRSTDGGESFSRLRVLSQKGMSASFPAIEVDDGGDLHIVWERYPGPGDDPRGLGYIRSTDGGDSFDEPAVVPHTSDPALGVNGSMQGKLMDKIAVAGDDVVRVVNSSFDAGEASVVYLVPGREQGADEE